MVPEEEYYKCTNCGATWNDTPKMGPPELQVVDRFTGGTPGEYGSPSYTPTKRAQRRAAKARDGK